VVDPADYGLAVALAGRPADAIPVLENAARAPGADSRARQNLALALGLAGDWTNARAVASQDVPADQLDARIHQWMQMATPGQQSTAVASLIGVTPASADPGQPVQLALNKVGAQAETRVASAAPLSAPPAAPAPTQQAPLTVPPLVSPSVPAPAPASVAVAEASPPVDAMPFVDVHAKAKRAPKMAQARAATAPKPAVRTAAAARRGSSSAVVQLGAYRNSKSVLTAWNSAARRYRSLLTYAPMSARFSSSTGTFYRLSVKGFGSVNEAMALCSSLRRSGGTCFVRNVAGDAPVQIASR
jgi:Flp pilus assembly protein TadD, contains TPR repeats